jgi:TonB family protein
VLAARTASKQGDVYSLGAILYQLLTGVPLPADPGARAAALAQAELGYDEGPIPADIRAVLDRCLAHRPEDRFSSAADFKKELDKLLYGGAYSPTTFNLALFMDRLFRPEIEAEERERLEESNVDVSAFLTPEPEEFVEEAPPAPSKAPWILAAAAIVVAAAVAGYFLLGGMRGGGVPPTPTPEEILAQRQAQQRQVETLVQEQVARMMEQREQELRTEFAESQAQIDDLTQQLRAKERELNQGGQGAAAAQREKERLERDLAAAEEQKRKKEAALEEERQRLLEEARRRMTEQQQARATAAAEEQDADAAAATPSPALASTQRTPAAEAARTPAPTTATPVPTRPGQQTAAVLVENSFVDFTEVDTRPEELKRHQVVWPRLAIHSRRKGVVILSATVNASGRVEEVSVLRADDKGFGIPQAAMDAVRRYVYKPATKDGVKVKTTVTVTLAYNFRQR